MSDGGDDLETRHQAAPRPGRFREHADVPLGEVVAARLRQRVRAGMDEPERTEARLARVHRHHRRTTP